MLRIEKCPKRCARLYLSRNKNFCRISWTWRERSVWPWNANRSLELFFVDKNAYKRACVEKKPRRMRKWLRWREWFSWNWRWRVLIISTSALGLNGLLARRLSALHSLINCLCYRQLAWKRVLRELRLKLLNACGLVCSTLPSSLTDLYKEASKAHRDVCDCFSTAVGELRRRMPQIFEKGTLHLLLIMDHVTRPAVKDGVVWNKAVQNESQIELTQAVDVEMVSLVEGAAALLQYAAGARCESVQLSGVSWTRSPLGVAKVDDHNVPLFLGAAEPVRDTDSLMID